MTENEKIRQVRNHFSLTMDAFGERVGLKKSTISLMESGRSSVSNSLRRAVCREFKVSEAWLKGEIEGNEIIFEETPADDAAKFASDHNLDKTEEVLIREYLNLTDGERATFRKYLKKVLSELSGVAAAADPDVPDANDGNMTDTDQPEGDERPNIFSRQDDSLQPFA